MEIKYLLIEITNIHFKKFHFEKTHTWYHKTDTFKIFFSFINFFFICLKFLSKKQDFFYTTFVKKKIICVCSVIKRRLRTEINVLYDWMIKRNKCCFFLNFIFNFCFQKRAILCVCKYIQVLTITHILYGNKNLQISIDNNINSIKISLALSSISINYGNYHW